MIIPYNVDRTTRRVPRFTYGLIGINTVIFLITIFISNLNLPTDKVDGERLIKEFLAQQSAGANGATAIESMDDESDGEAPGAPGVPAAPQTLGAQSYGLSSIDEGYNKLYRFRSEDLTSRWAKQQFHRALHPQKRIKAGFSSQSGGDSNAVETPEPPTQAQLDKLQAAIEKAKRDAEQYQAMEDAFHKADSADSYKRFWQIAHAYDSIVAEPHYSVLNIFAYRASQPSILGLLGSMFLHGGFMHLIGNMLFLWVFGRALEDTLGPAIYVGAYFLCGLAATLMYHVMMLQFTPHSAGIPSMGASGAIAGVLGLFALRFYRTPVRMLYVLPNVLVVVLIVAAIAAGIGGFVMGIPGAIGAFVAVWVCFVLYARQWAWGTFKAASMWAIGGWLLLFNLIPGIMALTRNEKAGGTAYWAHIGGFAFGMLYALLIGSKDEGALEYALEDAQKEYEMGSMELAITRAENVLAREPENAAAYEVLAKAYDQRGNEEGALDNYEIAIQKYLATGARGAAAAAYMHALKKNPGFILQPSVQFALSNEMAKNADYKEAADNLAKIPFTFPDAPEGEIALLRAAQIYVEQLNELDMATYLLNTLVDRYPDTQWMVQVQRILKIADYKSRPDEPAAPVEAPRAPSNRTQAQAPPVKK